ncbi:MAG: hypothetical protein QOH91_2025 [Mycobacterium sp.]|nr:hypothetical protein [Mycobacterium sp.]
MNSVHTDPSLSWCTTSGGADGLHTPMTRRRALPIVDRTLAERPGISVALSWLVTLSILATASGSTSVRIVASIKRRTETARAS